MKKHANQWKIILTFLALLILILDTKTALLGGVAGLQLCIEVLIPSLFPFFVVSNLLSYALIGSAFSCFRPLERLLKIPQGASSLVLLGALGGYPTGAQVIAEAERSGRLSPRDARRMLAFCCNAGPSFLFGIGVRIFPALWYCWLLWGIHLASALIVSFMTPGHPDSSRNVGKNFTLSLPAALKNSIQVLAVVCGWVILFKVILTFSQRWFLWLLPQEGQILIAGLLELSNGCCSLPELEKDGVKLVLATVFLAFGGLCVTMQTKSVAEGSDTSLYLPGKITQAAIGSLLCIPAQLLLPAQERMALPLWSIAICILIGIAYGLSLRKRKNNSSIYVKAGV